MNSQQKCLCVVRRRSLENATLPKDFGDSVRALLVEVDAAAVSKGGKGGPVSRHAHRDMLQNQLLKMKILLADPNVRGLPSVEEYDNPYVSLRTLRGFIFIRSNYCWRYPLSPHPLLSITTQCHTYIYYYMSHIL